MTIAQDSRQTKATRNGDFVFIKDSSGSSERYLLFLLERFPWVKQKECKTCSLGNRADVGAGGGGSKVKHGGGHVVPLKAILGEILDCAEEMVEEIDGGIRGMSTANVLDALEFKVLIANVTGIGEAIGAKQEGVARQEFQGGFIVGDTTEEAGRNASKLEGAALSIADEERAGHASADNAHLCAERIDDGVLNGAVATGDASKEESLV
jgi:hypothetical protein